MNERLFSMRFPLSTGNVSITAYDRGGRYDGVGNFLGHHKLHCQLSVDGIPLFKPDDFYIAIPAHETTDGDRARESAVALFCLKPGDTDADFFRDYTPEQLEWVTDNAEELHILKCERFGDKS